MSKESVWGTALKAVGLAGVLGVVWYLSSSTTAKEVDEEKMINFLEEFLDEFYPLTVNIYSAVDQFKRMGASEIAAGRLPADQIPAIVMQNGFADLIEKLKESLLNKHGISEAEYDLCSEMVLEGKLEGPIVSIMDKMDHILGMAFQGIYPRVPGDEVDADFPRGVALEILAETDTKKRENLAKMMREIPAEFINGAPDTEVVNRLMKQTEEIELQVIQARGFTHPRDLLRFKRSVGCLQTEDEEFRKARATAMQVNDELTRELLQPAPAFDVAEKVCESSGIIEKLTRAELPTILESAQEAKEPCVVCVIDDVEGADDEIVKTSAKTLGMFCVGAKRLHKDAEGHATIGFNWMFKSEALAAEVPFVTEELGKKGTPLFFVFTFYDKDGGAKDQSMSDWGDVRMATLTGLNVEGLHEMD